jgi:hypothetical protein
MKSMIDVNEETLLTFAEVTKSIPGRPHVSTLHRWRQKGVRGVKLETLLVGGRRMVSREALERFFTNITAAAENDAPSARTPRQRERAIAQAEQELREAGV